MTSIKFSELEVGDRFFVVEKNAGYFKVNYGDIYKRSYIKSTAMTGILVTVEGRPVAGIGSETYFAPYSLIKIN